MQLKIQKRIAACCLKCSEKKVFLDPERSEDIKEAITKTDIRSLIGEGAIKQKPDKGVSKFRARKIKVQKRKGRRKGSGSRKGKKTARLSNKKAWMQKIRTQRMFLKELREKNIIDRKTFQMLYLKSKGGFFRSKRHIKLYIEEQKLAKT